MARTLAAAAVPLPRLHRRKVKAGHVEFDIVEPDEVTHRRAMNLMINTTQVLQELGEEAEPTFEGLTLSGLTPGESVIVGPGGELQGTGGAASPANAAIAVTGAGFTGIVTFASGTEYGTGVDFSPAGDNTKIRVAVDGLYLVNVSAFVSDFGVSETFTIQILRNAAPAWSQQFPFVTTLSYHALISVLIPCSASDDLQVSVTRASGVLTGFDFQVALFGTT